MQVILAWNFPDCENYRRYPGRSGGYPRSVESFREKGFLMPMAPFYTCFPELALKEMRTVYVQGHPRLPDGHYGFLELYCNEKGCDCRRAIFQVVSSLTKDKVWATINYGWESVEYYEKWMPGDRETAREMAGATLDTLNAQTRYAEALLELFESLLLTD